MTTTTCSPVHELTADFSRIAGSIRPLNSTNLGPLSMHGCLDTTSYYRELGFPFVRLHDAPYAMFNTVDISNIFPLFHADETDPANYVFAPTDDYIQSILDCGGRIVYRLGQTIEHNKRRKYFIHPPIDTAKWARICVNIVRHYNEGWANGHRHGIRHWEIWCEPEINLLWSGTPDQYFQLYETTARALKAHDPDLMVGGPAACDFDDFSRNFATYCRDHQIPLDFFSWHNYNGIQKTYTAAIEVRTFLDGLGLNRVESHLNEWSRCFDGFVHMSDPGRLAGPMFARVAGPEGAAFVAAMLCLMQDLPLDMANYYWALPGGWGMFDSFGAPNKLYFSFKAFRLLRDLTPQRVQVTGNDPATGVAILAGLAEDGRSAGVLVANAEGPGSNWNGRGKLRLTLTGLPWVAEARVHVIDASHSLSPRETIPVTREPFELELPAPAAVWLELRPAP